MKRLVLLIILLLNLTGLVGCVNKTEADKIETTKQDLTKTKTVPKEKKIEDFESDIEIEPPLTQEELSLEAYEKFMKNEMKLSFGRCMPKDYLKGNLYEKKSEYTLSEVLDIITEHYFENSPDKKIEYIDYSYIDCGMDGVNELVLRFNGMDSYAIDDYSTLVYIIKYIDEKLFLCHYYDTWARSESSINEYGYYWSAGSGGATNHSSESALIDKEGNWQFIVSITSEADINQLAGSNNLGQIPKVTKTKGISGEIQIDTICFDDNEYTDNSDDVNNKEYFYTFYVFNDKGDPIKDEYIYTNSVYKDIFDEASVSFITPKEITDMIFEKEEKVGATIEIKEGGKMIWNTFSENIFSDYVKK